MYTIKFVGVDSDIPKKVQIFAAEQCIKAVSLSDKMWEVEIEQGQSIELRITHAMQNTFNKIAGLLFIYIVGVFGGTTGDAIIQALYVDTLKLSNVTEDVTIYYTGKGELFSIQSSVRHEIQRSVNKTEYQLVCCLFFLPLMMLLSWMIYVFSIGNAPLILKIPCIPVIGGIILYIIYFLISLYRKVRL